MADAKQCDKCKKLITSEYRKQITVSQIEVGFMSTGETYDLCPVCGNALIKWFREKENG